MRASRLGVSQAAAAAAALAATAAIIAFTLALHLPGFLTFSKIAVEESGEGERLSAVRLSLVAIIDGRAIISNDGAQPVTIKKIFTSDRVITLESPITIQPGQKVSISVGDTDSLAVELEGSGSVKVVLKEKPAVGTAVG